MRLNAYADTEVKQAGASLRHPPCLRIPMRLSRAAPLIRANQTAAVSAPGIPGQAH